MMKKGKNWFIKEKKSKVMLSILFLSVFLFSIMGVSAKELSCGEYSIVSLWNFNEGSGSSVEDICGVNEGVIIGTPNWTTGKYGNALSLNGSNWVDVGNDSSLTFGTGNFSISIWIKTSTSQNSKGLVDSWSNFPPDDEEYQLFITNNKTEFYCTDETNYPEVVGVTDVVDGVYHNIVGVREGEDLYLYVDGVLDANLTETGLGGIENNANLTIGAYSNFEGGVFTGDIDEVAIYGKALTPAEVLEIYEDEVVIVPTPSQYIQGSGEIYDVMVSSGAGLSLFMIYISQSIGLLLIILGIIAIIVSIGYAVSKVIVNSLNKGHK